MNGMTQSIKLNAQHVNGMTKSIKLDVQNENGMTHFDFAVLLRKIGY